MAVIWTNWSGHVAATPRALAHPESEAEVQTLVRAAAREGLRLRAAGSGHSFTRIAPTDGTLLLLDRMTGVVRADPAKRQATIRAGTLIADIGAPLWAQGLSLANQGDVDVQTLAGALSTGTHGTGETLGSLSTRVAAMRIVTADGGVLDVTPDETPELFQAARLSLGLFGVLTEVTLACEPAYHLHERQWTADVETCLRELDARIRATRHFEFFWSPEEDMCLMKSLDPTGDPPESVEGREGERIGPAFRIFPSVRERKFNECEFSVPRASGPDCFREIGAMMREKHAHVRWPIEYRTVKADDVWLSAAHTRDVVAISVHEDARRPFEPFFRDAEAIFRNHGGRPHWGKIHHLTRDDVTALYPMADRFRALRRELDPGGLFLNSHLEALFG